MRAGEGKARCQEEKASHKEEGDSERQEAAREKEEDTGKKGKLEGGTCESSAHASHSCLTGCTEQTAKPVKKFDMPGQIKERPPDVRATDFRTYSRHPRS